MILPSVSLVRRYLSRPFLGIIIIDLNIPSIRCQIHTTTLYAVGTLGGVRKLSVLELSVNAIITILPLYPAVGRQHLPYGECQETEFSGCFKMDCLLFFLG